MKHAMTRLRLPENGAARLYSLPDAPGFAWAVIVSANPEPARLESLKRRKGLSAILTRADGIAWPDWQGERLAVETLAIGGTVCLAFRNVANAIRCRKGLEGGAA